MQRSGKLSFNYDFFSGGMFLLHSFDNKLTGREKLQQPMFVRGCRMVCLLFLACRVNLGFEIVANRGRGYFSLNSSNIIIIILIRRKGEHLVARPHHNLSWKSFCSWLIQSSFTICKFWAFIFYSFKNQRGYEIPQLI